MNPKNIIPQSHYRDRYSLEINNRDHACNYILQDFLYFFGKVYEKFCTAVQKLVINLRQKFIWLLYSLLLIVFKKKKKY